MKAPLKFFAIGIITILLASCSKIDKPVYDGNADNNQTLLRLDNQAINFELDPDGTGTREITALSSTQSDEDRTFTVEFVQENDPNDMVSYDFDSSVTIPAGDFTGTFKVQVDSSNIGAVNPSLTLRLTAPDYDSDEVTLEKNEITITFMN